jgi:hypothetical protein
MEQTNTTSTMQLVSELLREVMGNACRTSPPPDRSRQQLARIARRLRERRNGPRREPGAARPAGGKEAA